MIRRFWHWISLVPGRRVTIYLINGEVVTGRVTGVGVRNVTMGFAWRRAYVGWAAVEQDAVVRSRTDEGTSWCRGWRGQAADAFRAVVALR